MGSAHITAQVLTQRQATVFAARLRGLTVKEVAAELNLSYSTVHNHLHRIYARLGVRSHQQAYMRLQGPCQACPFHPTGPALDTARLGPFGPNDKIPRSR